MTKDAINEYDTIAANNTDVGGVDLAENSMVPSDVNNAFREIMSHLKDVDSGASALSAPDINGGTIDGTVIGGASAAAGTFTTLSATSSIAGQNAVNRFGPSSGDADIRVLAGNAATSRVYFGDSDSETAGALAYYHSADLFEFGQTVQLSNAAGPALLNEAATSTNPTLVPNKADTDTGIGWASADTLTAVTGGSERLRITSANRLGVGISAPATKLHVLDGTSSLRFRQNGTVAETLTVGPSGGDAAVYLGDIADTVRAGLYYDTSENDLQIRGYNNSTRILIDSVGNVGIGTAPDSGTPLHVQESSASLPANPTASALLVERAGNVGMTLGTANTGTASIFLGDPDNLTTGRLQYDNNDNSLAFWANSNERLRVSHSGYVGVGTSAPAVKCEVNNGSTTGTALQVSTSGSGHNFDMVDGTGTARFRNVNGEMRLYGDLNTGGNGNIIFAPQGTGERLRLTSAGNAGFGISAPSYLLDLYKSASTVARVRNTAATGGTPSTTHGEFVIESTDANMGMQFLGSTTANQRILFGDTDSGGSGQVIYDHTSNYMALFTAAAERMRIGGGNVGIGTSSPDAAAKLDVNGQLLVRSTGAAADTTPGGQYGFYIQPDSSGTVNLMSYSSGGSTDIQFFTNSGGAAAVNAMTIDNAGAVTKPLQPAFLVYLSSTVQNVTGNGTVYTVAFDTEVFDRGGDFASNVFTAPVTGLYQLQAAVRLQGIVASTNIKVRVTTSNRTYQTFNQVNAGTDQTITLPVLADMDAADTAQVDVVVTGEGSDIVDVIGSGSPYQTTFSGHLVA